MKNSRGAAGCLFFFQYQADVPRSFTSFSAPPEILGISLQERVRSTLHPIEKGVESFMVLAMVPAGKTSEEISGDDLNGNFMQCAGTVDGVSVEWVHPSAAQEGDPGSWFSPSEEERNVVSVLGVELGGQEDQVVQHRWNDGTTFHLKQSEILTLDQAAEAFASYYENGIPRGFPICREFSL